MLRLTIAKILTGLLSAAGGLLFFWGFFSVSSGTPNLLFIGIGIAGMALAEALGVFILRYETAEALQLFRTRFWQDLGATWAFPLLLFLFYFIAKSHAVLGFSLVFAVFAFFRSASLIVKGYLLEIQPPLPQQ